MVWDVAGTHLGSEFEQKHSTFTPSRVASVSAGTDRRMLEVQAIKKRRGSLVGGLHPLARSSRKAAAHQVAATQVCRCLSHLQTAGSRRDGLFTRVIQRQ